jgi:hypothetical protein
MSLHKLYPKANEYEGKYSHTPQELYVSIECYLNQAIVFIEQNQHLTSLKLEDNQ